MRFSSLFVDALLFTSTLAASTPRLSKRDGLPACTSQPKATPPKGVKCGVQGTIDGTKASQNLISVTKKVASANACADLCRQTSSCVTFSYVPKKCSLYKQTLVQNKFKADTTSTTKWYNTQCFECVCGANQTKQADGSCSCSSGYLYSSTSQSCISCPQGAVVDSQTGNCACQGNQQLSSDGSACSCPAGSSIIDSSQPYQCYPDCPSGASRQGTGDCTCTQPDYQLSPDGKSCVYSPSCPMTGATYNGTACHCKYGAPSSDGTQCVCPPQSFQSGDSCVCFQNNLVPNNDGTACVNHCAVDDPNMIQMLDGSCGCQYTFQPNAQGRCACPDTTSQKNGSPYCSCPDNQQFSYDLNKCVCPTPSNNCECGANAAPSADQTRCDCPGNFQRSPNGIDCQCPSGLTNCGNSCDDLNNDKDSCGQCGHICDLVRGPDGHGVQYNCVQGRCVPPS